MNKCKLTIILLLIGAVTFTSLALWLSSSVRADVLPQPTPPLPIILEEAIEKELAAAPGVALRSQFFPAGVSVLTNQVIMTSVTDAEVWQGYSTAGCGSKLSMHVGYDDYLNPDGQVVRDLVKFNLASIPPGATINSAQLQLYLFSSWDYSGQSRLVTTYRVASPWAENIVNWNSAPVLAEAYGSASVTHESWGWYSFNVTDLVQSWHNGTYFNYGIALRGPEHSGSDSSWKEFTTSETIYPPRLIVNFTPRGAGDFVLTVEPPTRLVLSGESVSYTVSLSSTGRFTGGVSLTAGGLPEQTSYTWSTNPITLTPGSLKMFSTFYVSTTADTPLGSYALVITGTGNGLTHSAYVTLSVTTPDFGITASPSAQVVTQGDVATYTISLTTTQLSNQPVTLSMSSVPAGAVAVFTPNPATPPAVTTMTIQTAGMAPARYALTITGTGEGIVRTTSAALTVRPSIYSVYLPLVLKRYPPFPDQPVLHPIDNDNGEGEYIVDWEPADLADTYTLQEYVNGAWQGLYTGMETAFTVSGKSPGTYRYRVLATNRWGSTPSQEQSITVSDVDYNTVFLLIGVADYLNMDPPTAGARAGSPGYDPRYTLCDTSDVGDAVSQCACVSSAATQSFGPRVTAGCPVGKILALSDSQATKAAIQNAIVNWLDARETHNTTVVIFFSGHGSYGPDISPIDEADGYDEYIAPYDLECGPCGSTPETTVWLLEETGIRDDELADWLDELASQRIVLFIDSCFSGGAVDPASRMARGLSVAANGGVNVLQADDGLLADLSTPGRVVLTASAADQSSWEFGALKNGAFTYYLVEGLLSPAADANYNGRVSAEEAFAYLVGRADSYVYANTNDVQDGPFHQNPQLYDGVTGEIDLTLPVTVASCPNTD